MDNNAPILRRYVARAVSAGIEMKPGYPPPRMAPLWTANMIEEMESLGTDTGFVVKGWHAEFGFPGGVVAFVNDGDEPALYATQTDAENEARRVLVESLNARWSFREKRELSTKMTGDEFAADLAEVDIGPADFAMMWGTKQGKVMDWITGAAEVPFALRWILKLLRLPGAVDMAQKIVAENVTYKPEWLERKRQRAENEEGR